MFESLRPPPSTDLNLLIWSRTSKMIPVMQQTRQRLGWLLKLTVGGARSQTAGLAGPKVLPSLWNSGSENDKPTATIMLDPSYWGSAGKIELEVVQHEPHIQPSDWPSNMKCLQNDRTAPFFRPIRSCVTSWPSPKSGRSCRLNNWPYAWHFSVFFLYTQVVTRAD